MAWFRMKDSKPEALSDSISATLKAGMTDAEKFQYATYDPNAGEKGGYSNYSYWGSTIRAFLKNKTAVLFLILISITLIFTICEPLLPNPKEANTIYWSEDGSGRATSVEPNGEYWFGTNDIGQDLWSQIWSGTRTSLFIGFMVACVDAFFGILIGILWGYVRKLDFVFTELYNIFDNIPQTLVLILISYIMRPSITTMIFAMCLTSWLATARFIRNQVVIIRDRDYNLASRCLGTSTGRIMTKNLLPYLVSIITMRMALAIPAAIGNEVFITYIGLGLPKEVPSLGNLIEAGRRVMLEVTLRYQLLIPVVVLSIVTISFYIIGNAFADAADPKNHVN